MIDKYDYDADVERQAVAALHPDRDRLDRLARERRADVERIAEAIFVQGRHFAGSAFDVAEAFVAERDRRREK